jgi:type II secretory pathway component PulF
MVITALFIGFIVLTTAVVPRFAKLYEQFTARLPLPTLILIKINFIVRHYWWLLLILFIAFIFLFKKFISTAKGRYLWDNFKLKVPVFGPLTLKLVMSRFSRVTGTLMRSGVPLLEILELTREGVGNAVVAQTIDAIKTSVNEGKGMLEPIKLSGMFTPVVVQMVAVGEESGKLEDLLLHISDYYDSQIDYTINNLLTLIEPLLILILGIAVLFMALGIFLPMWNLMDLFRR